MNDNHELPQCLIDSPQWLVVNSHGVPVRGMTPGPFSVAYDELGGDERMAYFTTADDGFVFICHTPPINTEATVAFLKLANLSGSYYEEMPTKHNLTYPIHLIIKGEGTLNLASPFLRIIVASKLVVCTGKRTSEARDIILPGAEFMEEITKEVKRCQMKPW